VLWIRIRTDRWITYGFRKTKIAKAKSKKQKAKKKPYVFDELDVLSKKKPYVAFHIMIRKICKIFAISFLLSSKDSKQALYQDSAKNMDPH
jgi:hypothetical protein